MRVVRRSALWATAALATAALALTASPVAAVPVKAAEDSIDEPAASLELVVAPVEPVINADADEVEFRVLMNNVGDEALPAGTIRLSMGVRLEGESALDPPAMSDESGVLSDPEATNPDPADPDSGNADPDAVDPDAIDPNAADPHVSTVTIATLTVEAPDAGEQHEHLITVPVAELPIAPDAVRGVYPVYASFVADAETAGSPDAYTPIIWEGTAIAPGAAVGLTTIVPLVLPSEVRSMPSITQLADFTPRLDALLDFAIESSAVIAIDPRIVVAIRAYGAEAPLVAQDFLERLEDPSLTTFMLQFGDADPAVQAALGATELLQPEGFEFVTRHGSWPEEPPADDASGEPEVDPDADPEMGESNVDGGDATGAAPGDTDEAASTDDQPSPFTETGEPTYESLTAWPQGLPFAWPAEGQADARTVALLRGAGLSTTVLTSGNVTLQGGPLATLGDGEALVTDSELSDGVRRALSSTTTAEQELGFAQAAARLVLAADAGVPGLVLGVDRGSAADQPTSFELLESLTALDWVNSVALDAQQTGTAQLRGGAVGEERAELLAAAVGNESYVLEARTVLVNPEYLDSYQRMRLLTLFATRNAAPDFDFPALAKEFADRDEELHGAVRIVGASRAQLVGTSTRVPIQLRNPLPFDAVVNLAVAPTSAALSVPERRFEAVVLPEDSTERVLVPVNSRISTGESFLLLTVTSVDDEFVASTDILPVLISTNIETIALWLLAVAAVLLLGFGTWRSMRRRRGTFVRE